MGKLFVLLISAMFASDKRENDTANDPKYGENNENNEENPIVVKIEEDEYVKVDKKSRYIGVSYDKKMWRARRRSKNESKMLSNGCYNDQETAAHASDTLARKLIQNGEQNHTLNFPDDHKEFYVAEKSSKFIGVYHVNAKWKVQRYSKNKGTVAYFGHYDDERTAGLASDNLARKLMQNGEQNHKLNFPDEFTEVYPQEKSSKFIGVTYNKKDSKWRVTRWSKTENKSLHNGYYDNEKTAALASDTLARKLAENDGQNHELNFPDEYIEIYNNPE